MLVIVRNIPDGFRSPMRGISLSIIQARREIVSNDIHAAGENMAGKKRKGKNGTPDDGVERKARNSHFFFKPLDLDPRR